MRSFEGGYTFQGTGKIDFWYLKVCQSRNTKPIDSTPYKFITIEVLDLGVDYAP